MDDEPTYVKWRTITIDLPTNFITHTKNGLIKIKRPLTKTGNVSKANKQPAIVLRENPNIVEPIMTEKGIKQTMKEKKDEVQPIKDEIKKVKINARQKKKDLLKDIKNLWNHYQNIH